MFKKFLMSFLVSILSFGIVLAVIYNYKPMAKESIYTDVEVEKETENIEESTNSGFIKPLKDELDFLLVGVDSKTTDTDEMIRTDTMMLCHIDFVEKEIDILSIPRDSRVKIKGGYDKINHAHAYGGIDLTMETVKDYFDLDLNYYVRMDYNALIEAVDAIGGVEVDVPREMHYIREDEDFTIDLQPGLQVLDGYQSLGLVRWRQSVDYQTGYFDGDLGRIATQQLFIKAFIKQALKPSNILKLPTIVKAIYSNVDTNIPLNYIVSGLTFSTDLDNLDVNIETVPGTDGRIDGLSYFFPDEEQTEELLKDLNFKYRTGQERLDQIKDFNEKEYNRRVHNFDEPK